MPVKSLEKLHYTINHDRSYYESKCAALDRQIDQLADEPDELAAKEIVIVEESAQ